MADARDDYDSAFNGELDYDEDFAGEKCGPCAIAQSESEMNEGLAIDVMNGKADYDPEHVEKYL